jgi:hypothetical protein
LFFALFLLRANEALNFGIDNRVGRRQNLYVSLLSSLMPTSCKHPKVRVVSRQEDVEFVECQLCGEVFDSAEFVDILDEEDPADEIQETDGDTA